MTNEQIIKKLIRQNDRMMEELAGIQMQLKARQRSPWLDVKEAAAYCGYSRSAFYGKYKDEIPHHQRDTRIMFHIDDLEAWMNKNKKAPAVTEAIY